MNSCIILILIFIMQIDINGVRTNYQHIGKHGPILVLLHGWGGDWQTWHPVIVELSKDFQLIIPDLPGFGKTANPEQVWNIPQFNAWLSEFISQTVGTKKFILLGHSFGGQIAAAYAAAPQPINLKHLILVDAAGLPDELSAAKKTQQLIFGLIPQPLKYLISNKFKKKILELIGSSTDHLESNYYQRQVLRQVTRYHLQNELVKIKTPTTLIWGKNDDATPLPQGEKMANLIEQANLEIFENSGHFPFIDETIKFINIVHRQAKNAK